MGGVEPVKTILLAIMLTAAASAQVLVNLGSGGGGASAANDLSDVTITSVADTETLKYDTAAGAWINTNLFRVGGSQTTLTYDQGASGVTKAVFRAGLSQGSTTLMEWQNNGGALLSSISWEGQLTLPKITIGSNFGKWSSDLMTFRSSSQILFSAGTSASTGFDAGLRRKDIGVMQCTDGVVGGGVGYCTAFDSGSFRVSATTVIDASRNATFAKLAIEDNTTPTTAADACTIDNIWADANYIYFCVGSGNIKRVAIATW